MIYRTLLICFSLTFFISSCSNRNDISNIQLTEHLCVKKLFVDSTNLESMDSRLMSYDFETFSIQFSVGYGCNNFYEYDYEIVHPSDTLRIVNLRENDIDFVIAESKREVDLDYYRKNNVYFDTISGYSCKRIEPRVPFSGDYIFYFDSIGYNKGVNSNRCMYFIGSDIDNNSDLEKFHKFIHSISKCE